VTPLRPEEVVRLMFEARAAGDVRRVLALMDPDIVAVSTAEGRTLRGVPAIAGFFERERQGRVRTEVDAHRFVADGATVRVHGRVRVIEGGTMADSPAAWQFEVRDGRVVRIAPLPAAAAPLSRVA
jgi:ketosteroid isomerase-like protein